MRLNVNRSSAGALVIKAPVVAVLLALGLSACSTVSVNKQASAKTIVSERGNIVTDNKLSSQTASALLSAGLNEKACFQHFDLCLSQLSDSLLTDRYRQSLAVFAELHYAKARDLMESNDCKSALSRAPIDPYYANASPSQSEAQSLKQSAQSCLTSYQSRLFDAVKTSYAFLFYDSLDHDFETLVTAPITASTSKNGSQRRNTRLPTELDIQTQDIYNAASNAIITQLYESEDSPYQPLGKSTDMTVSYLPATVDTSEAATIGNTPALVGDPKRQVKVMTMATKDYRLNVFLPNENNYLQNSQKQTSALSDLISTYELRLSGLNSVSKRPGLGISLVASVDDRYTTTVRQLLASTLSGRLSQSDRSSDSREDDTASRIFPTGHLLITGLIQPTGKSVLEVLDSHQLDIHLYNPYRSDSVDILGENYPLAANFSASYGLWLAENQLDGVGYLNLLARQKEASLPKLFMLEPYDPNKRVIIMLHGLASSPAAWVNLTNDIFNDDILRDHYQVWQVFYPTNLPILENRYQIQKLLAATYQKTDPSGTQPASRNSVIIGHSMGGVIARMMLSNDNLTQRFDDLQDSDALTNANKRQINTFLKSAFSKEQLGERFALSPLPQVDTAVFLSTPFQGTDYADRWFTRALRRIIYLPLNIIKTATDNLAAMATQGDLAQNPLGALYLQNGASQLSDKSSFIKLTRDLSIDKKVTYHSIIASNDSDLTQGLAQLQSSGVKIDLSKADDEDNKTATNASKISEPLIAAVTVDDNQLSQALTKRLSDGIVPYSSAHLEGAASETIISGGHSIQSSPQTILTLRRILHDQLKNSP